jgi:hypothetical protein
MNSFEGSPPRESNPFDPELEDIAKTGELYKSVERIIMDSAILHSIADPLERKLLHEITPELSRDGRLWSFMPGVFAFRRRRGSHFPIPYALRMLELSLDKQFYRNLPNLYPRYAGTSDFWRDEDRFAAIDYDELEMDMAMRNQAYNDPQSYSIFHIESQLFSRLWDRQPIVVDNGDAAGMGLGQWVLKDKYPFNPLKVYKQPDRNTPLTKEMLEPDYEAQDIIDELMGRSSLLGGGVGYDIMPIAKDNDSDNEWAFNNTFPMSKKITDVRGVDKFRNLHAHSPDELRARHNILRLTRHNVDAADENSLAVLKDGLNGIRADGKADIFLFSGVLMQMSPQQRHQVFRNLQPYATANARFFINEWAVVKKGKLETLKERFWTRQGMFGNFMIDPHNPDMPPVAMAYFLTRKGNELILTEAGRKELFKRYKA